MVGSASTISLEGDEYVRRETRDDASAGADAFGLDLEFRERVAPAFRFLHDRYWRIEVSGVHNVPKSGPALLVANHSGALPFDGAMICTSADSSGRVVRFLYDRFVEALGPVAAFYRKVGGAPATRQNAIQLLQAGESVLIFPEGVPGVAKPFSERYHLQTFSPGFARLALALDVPVVPVAVVGAEEIYPLVGRAEGVGRILGAPYVPITPFFPVLGTPRRAAAAHQVVDPLRQAAAAPPGRERSPVAARTHRGRRRAAAGPGHGRALEAPPPLGLLRMREAADTARTYLRIGGEVFPVYGDTLRGFSPMAADVGGASRFVYESLDELYFALVNLWVARAGDS